jgi:stage II sporulation protein AA (anti-sigma F factor antagonist)
VTSDGYSIVEQREGAGVVRVCPAGDFDIDNQDDLGHGLLDAVHDPGVSHVVVDLSDSTFMGSCRLNAMVTAYNLAVSLKKQLRVINPRPPVRRVLDATGLTEVLIIE